MPSVTVPGQYRRLAIGAILDPPKFLLDTTFKEYNLSIDDTADSLIISGQSLSFCVQVIIILLPLGALFQPQGKTLTSDTASY
jgi:hypothetical protein